jgi:hypothetical protein
MNCLLFLFIFFNWEIGDVKKYVGPKDISLFSSGFRMRHIEINL